MIAEEIDRSTVGMALAAILAIVAMAFPWWTATSSASAGVVSVGADTSAGPFYTEGLVATWEAVLVGTLALGASVGMLVGFLALTGHLELHPAWEARVPGLVYGAGALLLVALLVAVVTWPADPGAFWGEAPDSGTGPAVVRTVSAGVGWFAALAAGLVGPLAMWDARKRGVVSGKEGDPTARPGPV